MPHDTDPAQPSSRPPLTRQRVLEVAVALADAHGIVALSMRKLARELEVEAMSLYHHVSNKEAILDGMIDHVFAQIATSLATPADAADTPSPAARPWQEAMRQRARAVRQVLLAHPWAVGLMDARRTPGPATLAHHDAVLRTLRQAGFSLPLAGRAFAALDSYIYGFILQEAHLPMHDRQEIAQTAASVMARMEGAHYPYLMEMILGRALRPDDALGDDFDFGLDLILEGLERQRQHG